MSRMPPLFPFNSINLSLFLFISKVAPQVVGCDAFDCGQSCSLGNVTASSIGVTSFNTSLSSEPLTWTIGISTNYVPEDSSNATYERAYFLGTPPDLSLANSASSQACVLFFEGVSQSINTTDGTCDSALGSACVVDLLSQAQGIMDGLSGNTTGGSASQCEDLMKAVQANVPSSCTTASDQNWGTISVRDLTGTNALSAISHSNCRATTGTDYQLSLVDTYTEEYEYNLPMLSEPFLMGTTPILSIFFPFVSSNQSIKSSEAHLSCLRVVPSTVSSKQNATTIASISAASKSSNSLGFFFNMVILAGCWNSMF